MGMESLAPLNMASRLMGLSLGASPGMFMEFRSCNFVIYFVDFFLFWFWVACAIVSRLC